MSPVARYPYNIDPATLNDMELLSLAFALAVYYAIHAFIAHTTM